MTRDTLSNDDTTSKAQALDDYVLLGRSGLRVSPLCLGTLTFGEQWGYGVNKEESKKVFDLYYEKGGNFFDTSCNYNLGESERFLGDYVSDKRSDVVIATKYSGNVTAVQKDRRFNPNSGKLIIVGILPWGIVAEGFLTGKYTRESAAALKPEARGFSVAIHSKIEKNWKILEEVTTISKEIDRTPVQVALNWVQQKPGITSPIIGARTVTQLEENLKTLEFKLTPEQMKRLDEVSKPAEIPFPHSYTYIFDRHLGKNIEVPKKFEPVASAYNFGRINNN
ncbi:unnamed protein product [Rhizophagus irregularis]|nr:unnamed protein product [Rhizophagus irregularis]